MLAIRMQRLGRKGRPTYRMVVQDSRQTPTSGKVVAQLGNYDPHAKTLNIDKAKAEFYLSNGAQPSDKVVSILTGEGVKMPSWVKVVKSATKTTKNPEKLRKNRPAEPAEASEPTVADGSEPVVENPEETTEEATPAQTENTPEPSTEEKPDSSEETEKA